MYYEDWTSHYHSHTHTRPPIVRVDRTSIGSTMPITLSDAKDACNVTDTSWDSLISFYVTAATRYCEQYTNMCFTGSEYIQNQSHWGCENKIWYPPLGDLTDITYFDPSNNEITLTVDTDIFLYKRTEQESILYFPWPLVIPYTAWYRPDAVQISYTTTPTAPVDLQQAVQLLVCTWFDKRATESEVMTYQLGFGVKALLSNLKVGVIS